MSLYTTGTVNMTNNSAAVVGVGTAFVANVTAGDGFLIAGEIVYYTVLSITDNTHLTLSVVYAGATGNGKTYQISRDWTVNLGLAEIQPGDPNWPYLLTQKVIRKIDTDVAPKASPIFTLQISTPKIVTASGNLILLPASYIATLGDGTATSTTLFYINGGANAGKGAYLGLQINSVTFGAISNEAALLGSGTSKELCFLSEAGLGQKWMVNGSAAAVMTLSSGGVLSCTNPVFINQIITPKITTTSGTLELTPAANAAVVIGDGTAGNSQVLTINGGTAAGKGGGFSLKKGGTQFCALYDEAGITGVGTSNTPCLLAEIGLGMKLFVNGSVTSANTLFIDSAMKLGIGISPTAKLHLPAGTAAVNTAPFKLTTSGTGIIGLLTTAEKGCIEFTDYGLWFSPADSTRHKVWAGLIGATAPGTNIIGTIADYFGTSATRVLTTPNTWISVVGNDGATYKLPGYS